MDFLTTGQYVELVEWSKEILNVFNPQLPEEQKSLLESIRHRDLNQVIEYFKKLNYTLIQNDTYNVILNQLEKNKATILTQWQFLDQFKPNEPFINLILEDSIIVCQSIDLTTDLPKLKSLTELKRFTVSPDILLLDGKPYQMKGLSSVDKIQSILKDSNIEEEFRKYEKYEKIVQFIEGIDISLQTLFSFHQIGIIIFQKEIYLVKWVQFLNEEQLISGKSDQKSDVAVLEEFGTKIGVQLLPNLELGNLVIFKNREGAAQGQETMLTPLFALDQSIFLTNKPKQLPKKWDFSNSQDCQDFVNEVLARIETGVLLLSKDKSTFVKDMKDLDLYIKISLQRIEGMPSLNQRINILRDLYSINTNPDNFPIIVNKLETNYILYLKEQFQQQNVHNIPFLIKGFAELHLFQTNVSLLIQTIVYLFDSYYAESDIILETVDFLQIHWQLTDELILLMERPQIVAITNNVIQRLNRGEFKEVIHYLKNYMKNHPYFRSYNILTLMIQIIMDIYHIKHQSQAISFSNTTYMNFFNDFINFINNQHAALSDTDKNEFRRIMQQNIILLSKDAEFVAYLNEKIIQFFLILKNINDFYLSKRIIHKIVQNMMEISPLVMFQRNLPAIGTQMFRFLTENYVNDEITIEFSSIFVSFFSNHVSTLENNATLLQKSAEIMLSIKAWIDSKQIPPAFLAPLKKEISSFLTRWYLSGQLPQHDFDIHKQLLYSWVDFVDLRSRLEEMMNILYIKDFIWSAEHFELKAMQVKYAELPPSVFNSNQQLLVQEILRMIQMHFSNFSQFQVIIQLFDQVQIDFKKLRLSGAVFKQIKDQFVSNLLESLTDIVHQGQSQRFQDIITSLKINLIYISPEFLRDLYQHFVLIYEMNVKEGERFNSRIQMMKIISIEIEQFLPQYDQIRELKKDFLQSEKEFIPKHFLLTYLSQLKEGSYHIFRETQRWLIQISTTDYLTYETTFKPVKLLFSNILEQFASSPIQILSDLKDIIREMFENQKMLNDNKKKFFKMILEILTQEKYPEFYPMLKDYSEFVEELADIESLYYTIKANDSNKVETVRKRVLKIIEKYSRLFLPWFIYANMLAIQEKYHEAINAYLEAIKYDSNQGNFARLYHNLLVAYLSQKKYLPAIDLVKKLDVGIRTYPHIIDLIRKLEQLTRERILND